MATIEDVINTQIGTINSTLTTARAIASRIHYGGIGVSTKSLGFKPNKPAMEKPMALSDLLPEDTSRDTIRFLDNESNKWMDKFFPELLGCLRSKPEEWICRILGGDDPYAGSEAVFDAVWNQARDQSWADADAQQAQIRAEFAGRGFAVPPGAMIGASLAVERSAAAAIGEVTRSQAVKLAEIKLDLIKFAEEQAIRLKLGILQSLADFYRQWVQVPNEALEAARLRAQAYATLQSALADYYRVELGFENLRFDTARASQVGHLEGERLKVHANDNGSVPAALAQTVRGFTDVGAQGTSAIAALVADLEGGS